jgi:hypothetical protein
MLKYLVCESVSSAHEFADARGWVPFAFGRYATPEGDQVVVATKPTDLRPSRAPLPFLKGPGSHAAAFDEMAKAGTAKWIKQ